MKKSKFKIDEVTLVLIVAILGIIVTVYTSNKEQDGMAADKITEILLDKKDISFVSGGIINEYKLREIQGMEYKELKDSLNAKNDFCVYIEDENGNILFAKGSSKVDNKGVCRE